MTDEKNTPVTAYTEQESKPSALPTLHLDPHHPGGVLSKVLAENGHAPELTLHGKPRPAVAAGADANAPSMIRTAMTTIDAAERKELRRGGMEVIEGTHTVTVHTRPGQPIIPQLPSGTRLRDLTNEAGTNKGGHGRE